MQASSSVAVAKADNADIPVLVELMAEFHAQSNYALDPQWAAESFAKLLQVEYRGAAWIARRGAEPAGYVVLTVRHSMEFGGLDGFIYDFFVRPGSRRQGVGTLLLDSLFEECRERNVLAVHVEVGHDNEAAVALYDAFGLRDSGRKHLSVSLSAHRSS